MKSYRKEMVFVKLWAKTKEFCRRHKTAIIAGVSGLGGVIGGVWLCNKFSGHDQNDTIDWKPLPDVEPNTDNASEEDDLSWADPIYQTIVAYEKKAEEGDNIWFEKPHWRDGWNKVEALASEIKPFPGEYYVIEEVNPDSTGEGVEWYIHHWDEDHPAYPTELVTVQKEE